MKNIMAMMVVGLFLIESYGAYANPPASQSSYTALFDEVCQIVEDNFYNPSLIREELPTIKKEYKEIVQTVSTQADFSAIVNAMLSRLNASHTYYLSPRDYEYYHLAGVFSFLPAIQKLFHHQDILYPTIGIITATIDDRVFVASVLPGSAAEQAGLLSGDEITAVNGASYQPIGSLKEHVGKQVQFTIRRNPGEKLQTVAVTPMLVNPKIEMLEAEKNSIKLIESRGSKIGYIHVYSYAGVEYHDELIAAISFGALKNADALIIDLRYGLGGADPTYLNIFNPHVPVVTSVDNTGKMSRYDPQWRKPAVYLVNKTSRSGKEILAFSAQKYKLATVIGERTAGAVLAATLYPLSSGDLLYLAGKSCLIDGVNLEGVGVVPDIEVPMDIRYCKGKDVQLERAVDYLVEALENRRRASN